MSIPTTDIQNVEVIVKALATSGGGGAKKDYNVFTYKRTTTVNPVSKANINAVFQATVTANMAVAMNQRWIGTEVTVRILDDPTDAETSFPCADVGAIATPSLPLASCVFMTLQTGLRGGSYRGAKHFSPANESDTLAGGDILDGAGLARWQGVQTAVASNLPDADGNVWVPTVYSRSLSSPLLLPLATIVANEVTQVVLTKTIGQLSRRKSPPVY